jgi:hypothetical protein
MLRTTRWIVVVLMVAGLAALQLSACSGKAKEVAVANDEKPATLQPIKGTSRLEVKLSAKAAERLGIRTASIRLARIGGAERKVIPYSAVLYDEHGNTYAYTSPQPRIFVRQRVKVDRIEDSEAILSHGPPSGTAVVSVGAPELHGVEYQVEED